jgi:hypothetical protein
MPALRCHFVLGVKLLARFPERYHFRLFVMTDKTGLSALDGAPLVAAITSACASSFLLLGYDQGVMSGIVISEY